MSDTRTLRQRIEYILLRALMALPGRLALRLSGRPAIELDGERLAPEIQLLLRLFALQREPRTEAMAPAQLRRLRRHGAAVVGGPREGSLKVSDLRLEGGVGLAARHYLPEEAAAAQPLIVFFHGGGFVFGDLETHDPFCRLLCAHSGAQVLAIDYRLAPEHPFPAAVQDARAALEWASANAGRLGVDRARIAVAGDSAGGNLAAVVCQLALRDGGPAPAAQLLIYPATDLLHEHRSRRLFAEGFFLTEEDMRWFDRQYLGSRIIDRGDPRISPLRAPDLSGLPPALVVTAGFAPLRDEGEAYAKALGAAGTPVVLRRCSGLIHGFINMTGVSRRSREAVIEIAGAMRALLAAAPAGSAPQAPGPQPAAAPEQAPLA